MNLLLGCCVTVMRPGMALCSPCSFYTSSPPSPFLSFCHLHSLGSLPLSLSVPIVTLIWKLCSPTIYFLHPLYPLLHLYIFHVLFLLNFYLFFLSLQQKRIINSHVFRHYIDISIYYIYVFLKSKNR